MSGLQVIGYVGLALLAICVARIAFAALSIRRDNRRRIDRRLGL